MSDRPFDLTRRTVSPMLLAWPLAALAVADEKKESSPKRISRGSTASPRR